MKSYSGSLFLYLYHEVYCFMLRSLIHLELNFVQDDRYGTMWIFVHAAIQFDKHRLLEMLSSLPVFISGFFIKKQVSIDPYVG